MSFRNRPRTHDDDDDDDGNPHGISSLIYSVPTVDSLGDESTLIPRPYVTHPRNTLQYTPAAAATTAIHTTPPRRTTTSAPPPIHHHQSPKSKPTLPKPPKSSSSSRTRSSRTSSNNNNSDRDFQHDEDAMSASVRTIHVAERCAFSLPSPPSIDEWQEISRKTGTGTHHRKLSPSLQHLQLLHKLNSVTHIRQLAFSASVGASADVLFDPTVETTDDTKKQSSKSSSSNNNKRDGRYRSIDPVSATIGVLPPVAPLLSNRKHRLPVRADVGFPNSPRVEMEMKQTEIQQETSWEEASPRLIVLVTSDDLGTAVVQEAEQQQIGVSMSSSTASASASTGAASSLSSSQNNRNGGGGVDRGSGLEGLPWAGPELLQAKAQNKRKTSSSKKSSNNDKTGNNANANNHTRLSMLAPPLDATFSRTLGWRPRPFHDRPPLHSYILCCPAQVQFAIGNIEPLVCSLTLYSLPPSTTSSGGGSSSSGSMFGKISEDFWFPAGDWTGRLEVDAVKMSSSSSRGGGNSSGTSSNGAQDPELVQAWHERKHKAIFSYHPLQIARHGELYVVLQVYKVTHVEAAVAYLDKQQLSSHNNSSKHNGSSLRKRLAKQFSKNVLKTSTTPTGTELLNVEMTSATRTNYRANAVYENFGTQFLTPLCFGVNPVFSSPSSLERSSLSRSDSEQVKWPKGETQGMQLYCFPSQSESQEDFCERLTRMVTTQSLNSHGEQLAVASLPSSPPPAMDDKSVVSTSTPIPSCAGSSIVSDNGEGPFSPSGKRKGVRRLLTPPRRASRTSPATKVSSSTTPSSSSKLSSKILEDTLQVAAQVNLFTSALDVDFLQSMLFSPPELDETNDNYGDKKQKKRLPKILVDVSGDSAIMMDPNRIGLAHSSTTSEHTRKRSSLVRLPNRSKLGGYLDASEIREVLFLPPRPDKNYDIDVPPSSQSLLNLLYLYPRLLRLPSEEKAAEIKSQRGCRQRYSVRVRLLQSAVDMDKETGNVESANTALEYFHNPAPWAGPQMLNAVYTRIPGDFHGKHDPDDLGVGIPIKDEFKLRLPMVLDGTHYLHFTLFSVDLQDDLGDDTMSVDFSGDEGCGISLRPLAETTIPLSSSSTKDPLSGVKATTIIPNGCHRLKLGKFQLHVETRLLSSIHVTDPGVAVALRDFPSVNDADDQVSGERPRELVLVANRSVLGRQNSTDSSVPEKVSYSSLFSTASGSTLMGHFQPLLFLHLSNLVNVGNSTNHSEVSGKFLVENIQSLLEICKRIKLSLLSNPYDQNSKHRLEAFMKASMDAFDEGILHSASPKQDSEEDTASEVLQVEPSRSSNSVNLAESAEDEDEEFDGGAIRKRNKDSLRSGIDLRISRTFSAMESSGIPFSRVAYGASKTDRMRLEAELDADNSRFTHLVDDDETVVTTANGFHSVNELRMAEAREAIASNWRTAKDTLKDVAEKTSVNSIESESPLHSGGQETYPYARSLGELGVVRRVKSAAQVMLAPCVTPNLSTVLSSKINSPVHAKPREETHKGVANDFVRTRMKSKIDKDKKEQQLRSVTSPGSDVEEEELNRTIDQGYQTRDGTFRFPAHGPVLTFSIQPVRGHGRFEFPLARGEFLYESILVLWLQAWLDHVDKNSKDNAPSDQHSSTNIIPAFDLGSPLDGAVLSFYAHMDLLLPLCLKSIILRYSQEVQPLHSRTTKAIVDEGHMAVLEPFVEMLARGLMGQALGSSGSAVDEEGLSRALASADIVLEFLIGICTVLHPAHLVVLIRKFFKTLRNSETEHLENEEGEIIFEWTRESLHRVRCSRQLRIRAVEKLAVLPNFIALNFPLKYSSRQPSGRPTKANWRNQFSDTKNEKSLTADDAIHDDIRDLLPPSGWLADLLTTECLSICSLSCEAVVAEAMAHIETHQEGSKSPSSMASSLKKRPTAVLKRADLLMFQSIAIHAITCLHELLLRRHAMDKRFQTERSRGRIAALFIKPIFERSLASVRWLARMESTHKVRSLWLLGFVYILQEAPEGLIRDAVRSYSDPKVRPDARSKKFNPEIVYNIPFLSLSPVEN
jgi:hypothetical protein